MQVLDLSRWLKYRHPLKLVVSFGIIMARFLIWKKSSLLTLNHEIYQPSHSEDHDKLTRKKGISALDFDASRAVSTLEATRLF